MQSPQMFRMQTQVVLRREMELSQLVDRAVTMSVTTEVSSGACQVCGDFEVLHLVQARAYGVSARLCPDCVRAVRR